MRTLSFSAAVIVSETAPGPAGRRLLGRCGRRQQQRLVPHTPLHCAPASSSQLRADRRDTQRTVDALEALLDDCRQGLGLDPITWKPGSRSLAGAARQATAKQPCRPLKSCSPSGHRPSALTTGGRCTRRTNSPTGSDTTGKQPSRYESSRNSSPTPSGRSELTTRKSCKSGLTSPTGKARRATHRRRCGAQENVPLQSVHGARHLTTLNYRATRPLARRRRRRPGAVQAFEQLRPTGADPGTDHQHVLNTRSDLARYRGEAGSPPASSPRGTRVRVSARAPTRPLGDPRQP